MVSAMLVGWGAGSPLAGWISDRMRRRRPVMLAGSILTLIGWLLLLTLPALPVAALALLLAAIGVAGGGMVLAYALGRDVAPAGAAGVMSGLINTVTIAAGALMQPFIGLLMDWQWDGALDAGVRVYAASAYERAFICFPLLSLVGVGLLALVREGSRRPIGGDPAPISR
jgi:MFS family permease